MIGGAQGAGVDSSATIFARACAYGGLFVYGKREYYSNIKGMHSYFTVRVNDKRVLSHKDAVDLLASFDAETVIRHAHEVIENGGIIYNVENEDIDANNIQTIEQNVLKDLKERLSVVGLGTKVKDVLELARRNNVKLYPIPYSKLLKEIGEKIGIDKMSLLMRMSNVIAVSASFALLSYDADLLNKAIRRIFSVKPKVAENNVLAAKITWNYVKDNFNDFPYKLEKVNVSEKRILIDGNTAVALGKIVGGCRMQTYYPITPAADESIYIESYEVFDLINELSNIEKKGSILVVQTEDEIAAIAMANGACLAGVRAATSTSGPGFSLMVEGLSWAGMNEVPVVITYYQRGAPSTGLPTRHEQGDLLFAIRAGHGEFTRIVLASGDHEECFYDAIKAFNYAERYQVPVIHLVDKALANSTSTIKAFDTSNVKIDRGLMLSKEELKKIVENEGVYKRFKLTDSGISPRTILGIEDGIFWNTGDEHNELGNISEEPNNRMKMVEKRMKKLKLIKEDIQDKEKANLFGDISADTIIVSWGSTKGAIIDALNMLEEKGIILGFMQFRLLYPFPDSYAKRILAGKRVIDVEMNYSGQFAELLFEYAGIKANHRILKYNGRPMSCDEVYHAIRKVLSDGDERVVLSYGA
jgi:2-oxoglutarate ferredoxin oxidoreductase subunit alpha